MPLEFCFPDVGEGIMEGEVVRWLVAVGDVVRADQPLVEIETDKAVVEIPAPRPGTIVRLAVDEGETLRVGDVMVVIGEDGETDSRLQTPAEPSEQAPSVVGKLPQAETILPAPSDIAAAPTAAAASRRVLAIPSVRRLARELGVDLTQVTPTGPRGRIRRDDVLQTASMPPDAADQSAANVTPAVPEDRHDLHDDDGPVTLEPLSALRRTIAEAMVRAASTAVPITTTDEADVTELLAWRQRSNAAAEAQGVNITLLPFIMKAVVAALHQHPQLNATLDPSMRHLVLKHYYHLGIATDTSDGLIVPVIRDVGQKNILTLAMELKRLTDLARIRRIALADLRGGTFTISNYGAIGGIFATPMLHLPQVAILGLGRLLQRPVARDGAVIIRTLLPLSLTFDHRALDGAHAQRFLNELIAYLADPARFFLVI
jgi:pyruvate dehydrogenase E2 component (dihydrolipoamide acetyltransferase)